MTLNEVAQKLGKSPSTIRNNLKRTQENLKKKGILLIKRETNCYEIEYIDLDKAKKDSKGE